MFTLVCQDALDGVVHCELEPDVLSSIIEMRAFILKATADAAVGGILGIKEGEQVVKVLNAIHKLKGIEEVFPNENVEHFTIRETCSVSCACLVSVSKAMELDPQAVTMTVYMTAKQKIDLFQQLPFVKGAGPDITSSHHLRRIVECVNKLIATSDGKMTNMRNRLTTLALEARERQT